ncbi:MAG: hypothetical protein RR225_05380 [Clostridium sp.]
MNSGTLFLQKTSHSREIERKDISESDYQLMFVRNDCMNMVEVDKERIYELTKHGNCKKCTRKACVDRVDEFDLRNERYEYEKEIAKLKRDAYTSDMNYRRQKDITKYLTIVFITIIAIKCLLLLMP